MPDNEAVNWATLLGALLAVLGGAGIWSVVTTWINRRADKGKDKASEAFTLAQAQEQQIRTVLSVMAQLQERLVAEKKTLEERITLLEKRLHGLEVDLEAERDKRRQIQSEADEMRSRLGRLQAENERLLTENARLRSDYDTLAKRLEQIEHKPE